ncbi:MAG: protein kinase [Myxococcaceae bacterium]|nr:protein kinase [Myxococcaceae bacterium]
MGEVFLARKLGTGGFERDVALKTVLPVLAGHAKASAFLKGFVDEARLAALLHHNNICQVYDLQPLEGRGLIQVLEYIPGNSLKAIIETARKKRVALTEPFACYVASELASALDYAHHATDSSGRPLGIVHRDVTPHNVMVTDSGSVKLLDFGIAFSSLENREGTTSNMVKGKDQYYAPEQLVGTPLDGRTDQFTLALCLYEMLVLKRFFQRGSMDTDTQLHLRIAQLTPESVEERLAEAPIDASLKNILLHALAPSREERFATCADFGDALRVFTQRRGLICTAVEARKEVEALFALPDAGDAEKTSPSGNRVYSVQPRRVPKSTMKLPSLTPGRTAFTPPAPPAEAKVPPEASASRRQAPASAAAVTVRLPSPTAAPPASDEASASVSASLSTGAKSAAAAAAERSALRKRLQLQEDIHNPKASAKKALALPAAILVGTLVVGGGLVKLVLLSQSPPADAGSLEVVKTPEQLRAQQEAQQRAAEPTAVAPELAPLAPVPQPSAAPGDVLPATARDVAPPRGDPQPPSPSSPPGRRPKAVASDARAVDALLAQQYGGRPVVSPDAPQGAVAAPPAAPGGRRRSYDTELIAEATPRAAQGVRLPKGTTIPARLTSPADASQPAPASAVVAADVLVDGVLAVPRGTGLVCLTQPQSGQRVGLQCDTLNLKGAPLAIDAIAMGADKRVGLALPRIAASTDTTGDVVKEGALNTARNLVGRAAPEGAAGDVVNGAADTASSAMRGRPAAEAAPPPLVPAGTTFTLFLQQPAN